SRIRRPQSPSSPERCSRSSVSTGFNAGFASGSRAGRRRWPPARLAVLESPGMRLSRLRASLLSRAPSLGGLPVLALAWDLAVRVSPVPLLPGPIAVARAIGELGEKGFLFKHVVASLFRVTWGYLLAVLLGVPLGILLAWYRRGGLAVGPLVEIVRPISALAWIPLAILWFGVGDLAAVFIIFIASVFPLAVAAMSAVEGVSSTHWNAGRNFGLSAGEIGRRGLLPAILPRLLVGLRLALGIAWLVVVAAEMIAVNSG